MNVILIGTSRLIYLCAERIREYYGAGADIAVYDTDPSRMNARYAGAFEIVTGTKAELMDRLEAVDRPSLVLSVNNRYLIPGRVIENANLTLVNLHHALLPAHPGRNAEAWTIFDGDEYGGVTWHYIVPDVDAGRIIRQASVRITDTTRSSDLLKQCQRLALESLSDLLPFEKLGEMEATEQLPSQRRQVRLSTQAPGDGVLDPDWPIDKISRFLRAMDYAAVHPMGYPRLFVDGEPREIVRYTISEDDAWTGEKVRADGEDPSRVVIREGRLRVDLKVRRPRPDADD